MSHYTPARTIVAVVCGACACFAFAAAYCGCKPADTAYAFELNECVQNSLTRVQTDECRNAVEAKYFDGGKDGAK